MIGLATESKRMKGLARIRQFMMEVRAEMTKVSWPTRQQLIESTRLVLIMTGLLAFFLGIWDLCASQLIRFILR